MLLAIINTIPKCLRPFGRLSVFSNKNSVKVRDLDIELGIFDLADFVPQRVVEPFLPRNWGMHNDTRDMF
jgi:hypothetical protein